LSLSQQAGPSYLLDKFLFNKDLTVQINSLLMFIFYIGNILHGGKKPINSNNSKFQEFIGINETNIKLMETFGYELNEDNFFHFKPGFNQSALPKILEELSLRKDILSGGTSNNSIYKFSEAMPEICRDLGAACNC
jgi:hypothetical protein